MTFVEWTKFNRDNNVKWPHIVMWLYWDIFVKWFAIIFFQRVWDAALKYGTQSTNTQRCKGEIFSVCPCDYCIYDRKSDNCNDCVDYCLFAGKKLSPVA